MKNSELAIMTNWRFCRVRAGEKKPYPDNWQNTPLSLDQVDSGNIGLLLGASSDYTCAIDFDGASSWDWLARKGIVELPDTISWGSGRRDRRQLAYQVSSSVAQELATKKITTGIKEGFEFRWTGSQSVLPPSVHPDTQQPYMWDLPPSKVKLAPIPDDLLALWLRECRKVPKETQAPVRPDEYVITDDDIDEAEQALAAVKQRHPQLGYDDWRNCAWALAHHIGVNQAQILLQRYYPEQRRNEYRNLFHSFNTSRSPTLGTLYHLAGQSQIQKHAQRLYEYNRREEEIQQLERRIQELKNGR